MTIQFTWNFNIQYYPFDIHCFLVESTSLIGQLLYIIGSDEVADEVNLEDKYKNVYGLVVLDAVHIEDKLVACIFFIHVPSDVPTGELFLPSKTF